MHHFAGHAAPCTRSMCTIPPGVFTQLISLFHQYSTFLEKWSQKMLIFGVKSSFLELRILAVQKRELIIEEVHILIQMPIFLGLLKLFVDKCRNEWYIPI